MTPLRDNLDRAKAGYGGLRYRGNLARDVLGAMPAGQAPNLWRRRALAIAAAVALSAATFFAGSYVGRTSVTHGEIAQTTQTIDVPTPADQSPVAPTTMPSATDTSVVATNEDFTLVPTPASASSASTSTAESTAQASMDFSLSVPSSPMLFSLATLADDEATSSTTTDDGELEKRS